MVSLTRAWRWLLGPRPWLLLGPAALLLALLGAFTYVLLDSRAEARGEAEKRFRDRATATAKLTAAILTASTGSGQAAAAKTYGGRTVDEQALTAAAKASRQPYSLILDRDGTILAASEGTPALVRQKVRSKPTHIRRALAGNASLSDVLPAPTGNGSIIESASPFPTPFGRRVEVDALDASLLFQFLSAALAGSSSQSYVLDSQNRLVANSEESAKPGDRLKATSALLSALADGPSGHYQASGTTSERERGTDHYFTSAPIPGSTWRVVLSDPKGRLYPSLAGSRSWLVFEVLAAFAIAGALGLLFLRRALVSGAELAETNDELSSLNASLEERVAERTAVVEEHARELARSNVELEQFSSVASHDLQEPLRKIRMFGDRLSVGLGDSLPREPASDLARMQNAAGRMQRLIDDLLDFSRVTQRGREFQRVDLRKVTEEVLGDLEARVAGLNAQVEVGELPVIDADPTQMRQLLQNLVGNALKFHREDEPPVVRISGDVIPGQAPRWSGETTTGGCCVITVEDNGIGFDEQYSERIFTAFERLHNRAAYEGTGIGLSIARKIAWRHGGDITAKSAPGQGATFTVTLLLSHGNGSNGSGGGSPQ